MTTNKMSHTERWEMIKLLSEELGGEEAILKDLIDYPDGEKRSGTLPEKNRKKGGSIKRKRGGKIMIGYKAGGKV